MGSLFEPMANSLLHLSMKTFLLVITSVKRIVERGALKAYSIYPVFHFELVFLKPHPNFLLKILSDFCF